MYCVHFKIKLNSISILKLFTLRYTRNKGPLDFCSKDTLKYCFKFIVVLTLINK